MVVANSTFLLRPIWSMQAHECARARNTVPSTLSQLYTKPLEYQGSLVQIGAHFDIIWPIYKIARLSLSLFDETLGMRLFTKDTCSTKP